MVTTAHVAVGSVIVATSVLVTLRAGPFYSVVLAQQVAAPFDRSGGGRMSMPSVIAAPQVETPSDLLTRAVVIIWNSRSRKSRCWSW